MKIWAGVKRRVRDLNPTYSGSQKSEVCPMPYALCPMPYALCPMPMSTSYESSKGYTYFPFHLFENRYNF